jgi:hypothetical protein
MANEAMISDQDCEWLCKIASPAEFASFIKTISYGSLNHIYTIISEKIDDINLQIQTRADSNIEWTKKARTALSFNKQKLNILSSRINYLRISSVSNILSRIGKDIKLKDRRLVVIRCLLSIIQHHLSMSSLSDDEKGIFDLASSLADDSSDKFFGPLTYDFTSNKVVSGRAIDVCFLVDDEFLKSEYGLLFAHSPQLLSSIRQAIPLLRRVSHYCPAESEIAQHIEDLRESFQDIANQH